MRALPSSMRRASPRALEPGRAVVVIYNLIFWPYLILT
ncbi:Hypothetical protein A7982_06550 [Minicystis rosea]|nr:Hypothetical protein A7982_06550 [Minicystis rosea]